MPKLNSEEIKKVVAEQAQIFNDLDTNGHFYEAEKKSERLDNPKNWKRFDKKLVSSWFSLGFPFEECELYPDLTKEYGVYFSDWEGETILGDVSLTNERCITRHFVHKYANSSLDVCVLTDEKDEQIIALLWHSD